MNNLDIDEMENEPPPPLGINNISMPESEYYDQWGNLKGPPVKIIDECHGDNFIKIFLYNYTSISTITHNRGADYYFGFQIKLEKLVRQKKANIADRPLRGVEEARQAAQNMIIDLCKRNHAIKRLFADFTVIRYNQPELF